MLVNKRDEMAMSFFYQVINRIPPQDMLSDAQIQGCEVVAERVASLAYALADAMNAKSVVAKPERKPTVGDKLICLTVPKLHHGYFTPGSVYVVTKTDYGSDGDLELQMSCDKGIQLWCNRSAFGTSMTGESK